MKVIRVDLVRVVSVLCRDMGLDVLGGVNGFLRYESKLQYRNAVRGGYCFWDDKIMNDVSLHALDVYKRYLGLECYRKNKSLVGSE